MFDWKVRLNQSMNMGSTKNQELTNGKVVFVYTDQQGSEP